MTNSQGNLIQEVAALNIALAVDVLRARDALLTNHSDTERRTFVRAMFAQIEGMTYQMKQLVVRKYDLGQFTLGEGEYAILKEISYDLAET